MLRDRNSDKEDSEDVGSFRKKFDKENTLMGRD